MLGQFLICRIENNVYKNIKIVYNVKLFREHPFGALDKHVKNQKFSSQLVHSRWRFRSQCDDYKQMNFARCTSSFCFVFIDHDAQEIIVGFN